MSYPKPNTDADYRASVQECLDRAQRALEVAEMNLDTVAGLFNRPLSSMNYTDLIAHGDARTRLGIAWADLAAKKHTETAPTSISAPSARVVITAPDDEHVVISVDDEEVAWANHDEHGWSGMDAIVHGALALAKAGGLTVEDAR